MRFVCVDAANGYTKYFVERVKRIRETFPELTIMAGNVATPDMVQELLISGAADIVKIGIGPGSVCTTRMMTGVGYPQLSAIIECADAAHGLAGSRLCRRWLPVAWRCGQGIRSRCRFRDARRHAGRA